MYQRSPNLVNKPYWERSYTPYWGGLVTTLNAIIFAKKGTQLIKDYTNLLLYYWNTQDKIIDYFFFQLMIQTLERKTGVSICNIKSDDSYPHLLQTYINDKDSSWIDLDNIFRNCSIHKLCYFSEEGIALLEKIIKHRGILDNIK